MRPEPTPYRYDWMLPDYLRIGTSLDIYDLLRVILNTLVLITIVTAVIYLILNGIKFIISGGDSSKAQEAQKGIMYAIIGIIVALASAILVEFVLERLNFSVQWF